MTFREHEHPRAAGGRWTAKTHAPAEGVDLAEGPALLDQANDAMLAATGSHDTSVESGRSCGGGQYVQVEADVAGDARGRTLNLSYVDRDGAASEVRATVSWPISVDWAPTLDSSSTFAQLPQQHQAVEGDMERTLQEALTLAEVQMRLDESVNHPQSALRVAEGAPWSKTVHLHAVSDGEHRSVRVENYGDARSRRVDLTVDDQGGLTGGTIETDYGRLDLAGENLQRVSHWIHRELLMGLGRWDDVSSASAQGLQDIITAAFNPAEEARP